MSTQVTQQLSHDRLTECNNVPRGPCLVLLSEWKCVCVFVCICICIFICLYLFIVMFGMEMCLRVFEYKTFALSSAKFKLSLFCQKFKLNLFCQTQFENYTLGYFEDDVTLVPMVPFVNILSSLFIAQLFGYKVLAWL